MFRRAYNMTDETEFQNCYNIHPLMQLEVYHLIQFLIPRGLKKLVVFGSSTTKYCHVWSDLDIHMEGCTRADVEDYEPLRDVSIDLVPSTPTKKAPIWRQIDKTGVTVYG